MYSLPSRSQIRAALAPIDVDRVLAPRPEVRVRAAGQGLRARAGTSRAGGSRRSVGGWSSGGGFGGHERSLRAAVLDRRARRAFRGAERSGRNGGICHTARAVNADIARDAPISRANHARARARRAARADPRRSARSSTRSPRSGDDRRSPIADPTTAISYWLARVAGRAGATAARAATARRRRRDRRRPGSPGLWTAIALTDTDPSLRVVVLEAETVGFGASGRNGGFCQASPDPRPGQRDPPLPRRARASSSGRASPTSRRSSPSPASTASTAISRRPAPCRRRPAVPGRRVPGLGRRGGRVRRGARVPRSRRGPGRGPLAALAGRALPAARPRRRCSTRRSSCRGLARVAERARRRDPRGHAGSPASSGGPAASRSTTATARRSTPTTSSSRRRPTRAGCAAWRRQFVPVYDYVLVSEPLTPDQRASIGWARRQGMSDANNQFHYFRLTADDRILWGGYDAIYYPDNGVGPGLRPAAGDVREARGAVPSGVPAARRPPRSRTAGAARSTRRRGSR